ncbi:zinc-binding dehydrogenase [Pendulispora albinea]|uniref:Zinc-binding dehydrogenase n=1 Tax=Pendulispora albinea TaxID=2741071 RepID=A0ABZ2LYN0_9BACT
MARLLPEGMKNMRSVLYDRHGQPDEVLRVAQVEDPGPPGPGEVLIRVRKRPVHPGDLLGIRGGARPLASTQPWPRGISPGFEGVGIIEALGPDLRRARGFVPGGRVAFFPVRGAWSECVRASAEFVTPVPDDVPDTVAAQMLVNPITAMLLLRAVDRANEGRAEKPGVIVQTSANSAVGRLVTTLARRRGLHVIHLVRTAEEAVALAARFADERVLATEDDRWREHVRREAGGEPIHAVLDAGGGALTFDLVALLSDGGTLVSYGSSGEGSTSLESLALATREITIRGISIARWTATRSPEERREDIAAAVELARTDPRPFDIAAEYDLAQIAQAVQHTERPGKFGTVLLTSEPRPPRERWIA